ncbi:hypothetical protein N8267_02285 [Pelagibacteraceae bacterium]|nr:hypothetical protein [Pelagibacteraceae bacterium]
MKDYHQVQKDRKKYHIQPFKNTVHRSSLIAPMMTGSDTWISFINHFLIKRGYKSVALKLSAIDDKGKLLDSKTLQIEEPKVYALNLTDIFNSFKVKNFLIDFFSEKNLFVPFPAVIVSHMGKDFCNIVHSFNRILNDSFEDDEINKNQVYESSIDLKIDKKYDTFFNLSSGMYDLKNENIFINYEKKKIKIKKKLKVSVPRLSYKSFYLSKILPGNLDEGVIKIKQPKQSMFYGRLLAGQMNKKTKAFSANHSYYVSSNKKEYFNSSESYKNYPYFKDFTNRITMYPIFSPSKLDVSIKLFSKNDVFISPKKSISSSSKQALSININDLVKSANFKNVTAFTIIAKSQKGKIPTRVNHQLIYGGLSKQNSLKSSIAVSLANDDRYVPNHKKGFVWGQMINHKDYNSKIGFCFYSSSGKEDKIKIDFYNSNGYLKTIKHNLHPQKSLILSANKIFNEKKFDFCWYVAKCERHDLSAYSVHVNKKSQNSSGEHNF